MILLAPSEVPQEKTLKYQCHRYTESQVKQVSLLVMWPQIVLCSDCVVRSFICLRYGAQI